MKFFHLERPGLTEEQRARIRRRSNVHAGIELILLGIVVPIGYFVSMVMMFNTPTPLGITLAVGSALILIILGIVAIRSGTQKPSP
jgi:hypothetical protein